MWQPILQVLLPLAGVNARSRVLHKCVCTTPAFMQIPVALFHALTAQIVVVAAREVGDALRGQLDDARGE